MHKLAKNNAGFSVVGVILAVVVIGLVGSVGWYTYHAKQVADKNYNDAVKSQNETSKKISKTPTPTNDGGNPLAYIIVTDTDNGKTITIKNGQNLLVQLGSTYWSFSTVSGNVLHTVGDPVIKAESDGVAGSGRGTVTAHYIAQNPGSTIVSASRVSCGEALACGPSESTYSIKIVVN